MANVDWERCINMNSNYTTEIKCQAEYLERVQKVSYPTKKSHH
jgi:hypothetical protein